MKQKIKSIASYAACSAATVILFNLFAGNGIVPAGPGFWSSVHAAPAPGCTVADTRGRFLVTSQGNSALGPQTSIGVLTSDGTGNFSGTSTGSVGGNVFQNVTYTGTAIVNPDCTYTSTTMDQFGAVDHYYGVSYNKGEEVYAVRTDPGKVVSLYFKRLQ